MIRRRYDERERNSEKALLPDCKVRLDMSVEVSSAS
jgi:hypothetical protein